MRIMKTFGYLAVFVAGILVGLAGAKLLLQSQLEGITLGEDITIYNRNLPVAELKTGSRFNREKNTKRCSLEFYLDHNQPQTHEIVEPYYSDKKQ